MRFVRLAVVGLIVAGACGRGEPAATLDDAPTTTIQPAYDGRLHVVFTPSPGQDPYASMSSWKIEPAPADITPTLTLDEATAKASEMEVVRTMLDDDKAHLYFGLFTGLEFNGNDAQGRVSTRQIDNVRAWLVFASGVASGPLYGGACEDCTGRAQTTFKGPMFGATAFRDDPNATEPISGTNSAGGSPVVY